MKFQWQSDPNLDRQTLHVTRRLPSPSREDEKHVHCELHRQLLAIDGVAEAKFPLRAYECLITKGRAFRWGPIHAAVIEVFRGLFGEMEPVEPEPVVKPLAEPDAIDWTPHRAFYFVATLIRDAVNRYRETRLSRDEDELNRLIGLFNLPEDRIVEAVEREYERQTKGSSYVH